MVKRILLIDVEADTPGGQLHSKWASHPIGLMYLASSAGRAFPDIQFRIFHTATAANPQEVIRSLLVQFDPDIVGLRSLSIARNAYIGVSELVREVKPNVPLLGGGPYASDEYEEVLRSKTVDLVGIGEGEETFVEIVREIREHGRIPMEVPGTAVVENGQVKKNAPRPLIQDVDGIPFPDYRLIDLKDYINRSNHAFQSLSDCAVLFTSRGCPYQCYYCHQMFGKKRFRRRSAENVIKEIRSHIDARGITNFIFVDDLFNVPKQECKDVLREIIKEVKGIRLNFPNGLRADQLDEEVIDLLQEAGTVQMALAVETINPKLQRIIGKNLDVEKARRAIENASEKFVLTVFFMVGFPSETYEQAMETIHFAEELDYVVQPVMSVLRIYGGSPIFQALNPTKEQTEAIIQQQGESYTPKLMDKMVFYGDLFSREQVPLTGHDIKKLRWEWMRRVVGNQKRVAQSHRVLKAHFSHEQVMEFYRNFYDKQSFEEEDYRTLEMSLA